MASSRSGAAANAARALAIGTLDGLNTRQVSAISKHLSWALRHKLNRLGVAADSEGWCRLDQVSSALVDLGERKPSELTVPVLLTVIARSNSQKARYMTRAKDGYTYVRALEFNERHPSGDHSYGRRRNEGHSGVHLRERPRSSLEGIPPWRWSSTVLDSKRILERCDKSLSDNDWSDLCGPTWPSAARSPQAGRPFGPSSPSRVQSRTRERGRSECLYPSSGRDFGPFRA